jgi:hypothetical protein
VEKFSGPPCRLRGWLINRRCNKIGARLCAKHQPQHVENPTASGFFQQTHFAKLLRLVYDTAALPAESGQNGSLPLFRHPAYFNPMTRKATGLLPDLGQTAVWLNAC